MCHQPTAEQRKQGNRQQHAFCHARIEPRKRLATRRQPALFRQDIFGVYIAQHAQHFVVLLRRTNAQPQAMAQQRMCAVQVQHADALFRQRTESGFRIRKTCGYAA